MEGGKDDGSAGVLALRLRPRESQCVARIALSSRPSASGACLMCVFLVDMNRETVRAKRIRTWAEQARMTSPRARAGHYEDRGADEQSRYQIVLLNSK